MKSSLVGSQSLGVINALFKSNPEIELMVASSMMIINEEKVEVKEAGKSLVEKK